MTGLYVSALSQTGSKYKVTIECGGEAQHISVRGVLSDLGDILKVGVLAGTVNELFDTGVHECHRLVPRGQAGCTDYALGLEKWLLGLEPQATFTFEEAARALNIDKADARHRKIEIGKAIKLIGYERYQLQDGKRRYRAAGPLLGPGDAASRDCESDESAGLIVKAEVVTKASPTEGGATEWDRALALYRAMFKPRVGDAGTAMSNQRAGGESTSEEPDA